MRSLRSKPQIFEDMTRYDMIYAMIHHENRTSHYETKTKHDVTFFNKKRKYVKKMKKFEKMKTILETEKICFFREI